MKCFGYGIETCDEQGTIPDYETPVAFINPEDRDGPKVRPVHCERHHKRLMSVRADNEASWNNSIFNRRSTW